MSRDFLSNFDRTEPKAKKEQRESENVEDSESLDFADHDYIRNICFVWPDGKRKFFSYARLDSGEINSEGDAIRLMFGVETVELEGFGLLPLFNSFIMHQRKIVYCDDARYNNLIENNATVNQINVVKE